MKGPGPSVLRAFAAPGQKARARVFGSITSIRTEENLAALAFDDGRDPASTPISLNMLARSGGLKFGPEAVFRKGPETIRRLSFANARADALLRRRNTDLPRFDPIAWASLAFGLAWSKGGRLLRQATGKAHKPYHLTFYQTQIGLLTGDLVGSLKFGVSPEQRGFGGIRGKLLRWTKVAIGRSLAPWCGSILSVKTPSKVISLTFDDGPDPETTPRLLDALAEVGAKATFFVIGSRAERHPDLIARILAEGHEIGNHTFSHPSLPTASPDRIETEIARTRLLLAPAGGKLMRPPYGDQTFAVNRTARKLGYRVVLWSINGKDWLDHDAVTLTERVCDQAEPGAIVLLHDSLFSTEMERYRERGPTIAAVKLIVSRLQDYRFLTVSQLLECGTPIEQAQRKTSDPDYLGNLILADSPSEARFGSQ